MPFILERSEDPCDDVKSRPVPKSFSVMMTQCNSAPEVKCVNLPRTVQVTIHEEECSNEGNESHSP